MNQHSQPEIEGLIERLNREAGKRAPVQGLRGGIPWAMHLRAYDAYCKRHGRQDALIDLEGRGCRGGFGTEELDVFIPGWREQLEQPMPPSLAAEAAQALSALLSLKEGGGLGSSSDGVARSQPDCSAAQSFAGPEVVAMAAVAAIDGDGAWDAYAPDERRRITNRIADAMRGGQ